MDKWMNNNNFNKILALVFSVILWSMVHLDSEPAPQYTSRLDTKIIENVRIDIEGLDEDKYVLYPLDTDSVRMEVQGKSTDISYVFSDDYKVTLDLSNAGPGTTTIPLSYSLPKGVTLVKLTPESVTVHLELRNTKEFPVTVAIKGKPADGYKVGTPVISPSGTATVTLPDSELGRVAKVQGTVELEGENKSVREKRMKLVALDAEGNEIDNAVITPATVSVEIPITLPFKSVPLDVGFAGSLPAGLVLSDASPEVESVTIYGQEAAIEKIEIVEATVDLGTVKSAGTVKVPLKLNPPEGSAEIEPGSVNVALTVSEVTQRTIDGIPIRLQGLGSGLEADVIAPESETVSLSLSGAPALLDRLSSGNIQVSADVSGLGAGSHQVSLQVSLPRFVTLNKAENPLVATVRLTAEAASPPPAKSPGGALRQLRTRPANRYPDKGTRRARRRKRRLRLRRPKDQALRRPPLQAKERLTGPAMVRPARHRAGMERLQRALLIQAALAPGNYSHSCSNEL